MGMPTITYSDEAAESWSNALNDLQGINAEVTLARPSLETGLTIEVEIVGAGTGPAPDFLYGLSFKRLDENDNATDEDEFLSCDDITDIYIY